jgi:hypothetical protein
VFQIKLQDNDLDATLPSLGHSDDLMNQLHQVSTEQGMIFYTFVLVVATASSTKGLWQNVSNIN